jgi:hypothetical protein
MQPKFWEHFFPRQTVCIIFTENGLGYILGDFFLKLVWSPCRKRRLSAKAIF